MRLQTSNDKLLWVERVIWLAHVQISLQYLPQQSNVYWILMLLIYLMSWLTESLLIIFPSEFRFPNWHRMYFVDVTLHQLDNFDEKVSNMEVLFLPTLASPTFSLVVFVLMSWKQSRILPENSIQKWVTSETFSFLFVFHEHFSSAAASLKSAFFFVELEKSFILRHRFDNPERITIYNSKSLAVNLTLVH